MTLHAPAGDVTLHVTALTVEAVPFPIPASATPGSPPRFAGEPVHWLHIDHSIAACAFVTGARRVFTNCAPGLPGDPTTQGALIEVTPMPGPNAAVLSALTGGTPVQYILIDAADLPTIATPALQIRVAGGDTLVTPGGTGAWIGLVRQDRICRDPRGWVDDLEAAAEGDTGPTWSGYAATVRDLVAPTVRLVDHTGRPLTSGSFTVNPGSGPGHTVTLTDPGGDTGIVVTGTGHISAPTAPNMVLASTSTDTGALGAATALSPTDRQFAVLALDSWMSARTPGVTALQTWTTGNHVEPIPDGSPYFARLVPDLRAAKFGGAVGFAGWAFVQEALADPTKVWSLLPEDNSTELVKLIHELRTKDAQGHAADVLILVNQFVQVSDAGIESLQVDAAVALVLLMVLLIGAFEFGKLQFNPAGWIVAGFALPAVVELTPNDALLSAIRAIGEPSKATLEAINSNDAGVAVWTPYPATLADNPLAENPLTIAHVPITALTHIGVYHEKIAVIRPADQPPIAYLGGIDINSNRLDDPAHRAFAPYHDVQVRLAGPVVADVITSFADRAAVASRPLPDGTPPDPLPQSPDLLGQQPLTAVGHHIVQIGRTRFAPATGAGHGDPFPSAPSGEDTTHRSILAAISAAQDYIYIEDQYFTPDDDYVRALIAAGEKTTPQVSALVITLPAEPDQPYGGNRRGEIIARLSTTWGERMKVGAPLRRYLNPTPQTFAGLGRMVLRAGANAHPDPATATPTALTPDDTEAYLGPADRVPTPPFWAFVDSEMIFVDTVLDQTGTGSIGTGPIGYQDPDQPDSPHQTWQHVSIKRSPLGQDQTWGAKPDNHDKNACVLAVQIPAIYVHAKLMVIDDIFMSVGSSNLNRRGFFHDGEMNAFAVPEHLKRDPANPALQLRCRLWAEHFGLPPEMGLSLLADPLSALPFFDRTWYRGTHWQPLRFGSGTQPPTVALSTGSSFFTTLLATLEDLIRVGDETPIWPTAVDPTTSLDHHTTPADSGPGLNPNL